RKYPSPSASWKNTHSWKMSAKTIDPSPEYLQDGTEKHILHSHSEYCILTAEYSLIGSYSQRAAS
ncbi:MAG: hypothetical protein WC693_07325, partial [Patescibacteria group bacterium]